MNYQIENMVQRHELPQARSITHEHILGIICSEIRNRPSLRTGKPVRVLDVGCGNGELIRYLHVSLQKIHPELDIRFYGLDVVDFGVQAEEYQKKTLSLLMTELPQIDWPHFVRFISHKEDWPFAPDFFNAVISNQVLEHVSDHDKFFRNQSRVLMNDGFAVHLFPVAEVVWEGHLSVPFIHWIKNWDRQRFWLKLMSRVGAGKWKRSGFNIDAYVEGHSDYMLHYTNYISKRDLLSRSKLAGLRPTFAYTGSFFKRKLKKIFRLNDSIYSDRSNLMDISLFPLFSRISSITLFQSKANSYARFE